MSLVRERIVLDPHGDALLLFEKVDDVPPGEGLDHHEDTVDRQEHHKTAEKLSAQITRREVELQVSSKHLSLASGVFSHCIEGQSKGINDIISAPLPDDDCGAIQILLNIIHGLTRKVPRRVDFQNLYSWSS